jgi:hypothetical protein
MNKKNTHHCEVELSLVTWVSTTPVSSSKRNAFGSVKNSPDVPAFTKMLSQKNDKICGGLDEHAARDVHSQNMGLIPRAK